MRAVYFSFILAFLSLYSLAMAQEKPLVAVFQVKVDKELRGKKLFTESELAKLTSIVRSQASKALGRNVEIMSDATIERLIGASLEECNGANCLAGFIQTISADYGVQPILSIAFKELEFRIEVASKNSLLAEPSNAYEPKESSKIQLAKEAQELAREAIGAIQVELGMGGVDLNPGRPDRENVDIDPVGTVVSFEFTDGAAVVLVDNKLACSNKEKCSKELSKGKHNITVSRDGYRDSTFGITVPSGSNRYVLALQSKAGVLTLRASDAESGEDVVAQVVIDGNVVGTTPWSGMVSTNARKIVLKADGYEDVEVSERAEEGKKRAVTGKMKAKLKAISTQISSSSNDELLQGTFIDSRDGKKYKTAKFGSQMWMAENLNYGSVVSDSKGQVNDGIVEKFCYDNLERYCDSDGGLYTWAEAMALPSMCNISNCSDKIDNRYHQGICPSGWHVPDNSDWYLLEQYLGGSNAGKKMKQPNTGFSNWDQLSDWNASGFASFPTGSRIRDLGYSGRGSTTYYWSAKENKMSEAQYFYLIFNKNSLNIGTYYKVTGVSLRCVRD